MATKRLLILTLIIPLLLGIWYFGSNRTETESVSYRTIEDDPNVASRIVSSRLNSNDLVITYIADTKPRIEGLPKDRYDIGTGVITIKNYQNDHFRLVFGKSSDVYEFGESQETITVELNWLVNDMVHKALNITIRNLQDSSDNLDIYTILNETNINFDEVTNVGWYERKKDVPYTYTVPGVTSCTPIESTSPNGTVIIVGEDCETIPSHQVQNKRDEWKERQLLSKTEEGELKYHWEQVTIQKAGQSKDTISFMLSFDVPIVATDDGWGSKGTIYVDINGITYVDKTHSSWWDANWENYQNHTITASTDIDQINDYFEFNISGLTLATDNCTLELRLIDGIDGTETDFIIVDDSGQAIGDGSEWCILGWNYTVLKNTNKNVSIYYNNAGATIPSYMDENLGFGTKWMGALDTAFEAATWTRVAGGATWANISIPEEGNWWGIKLTMAGGADKYQLVDAAVLNHTWIIRFNTSNTQATGADGSIRIGTGSGAGTDYYDGWCPSGDKWWRESNRPGVTYGSSDMKTVQTYKMTFNYADQNASIWVYNQSDGSAVTVASAAVTLVASVDNFFIGDNSAGGDSNPVYYFPFVGLSFAGAYPPLDVIPNVEESPPPPEPPKYSLNQTNSTLGGSDVLHSLNWTDDVGLSGYIFQFCNGTWNGSDCGGEEDWCYQESANVSTACGGLDTGVYEFGGIWKIGIWNETSTIDGDWNTYGLANIEKTAYLNINYTKPSGVLSSSLWQVKDENGIVNLTIPSSCWDYNSTALILRVNSSDTPNYGHWHCFDGSWNDLRGGAGVYQDIYEEAMWWDISSGGGWTNDTWASFGAGTWSNVTKTINSTVGGTVAWCVYANDTGDNWNGSSCVTPFDYVITTIGDTCDYSAGDWEVDCSENCEIDTDTDIGNNNLIFTGNGEIYMNADLIVGDTIFGDGCTVVFADGKTIVYT